MPWHQNSAKKPSSDHMVDFWCTFERLYFSILVRLNCNLYLVLYHRQILRNKSVGIVEANNSCTHVWVRHDIRVGPTASVVQVDSVGAILNEALVAVTLHFSHRKIPFRKFHLSKLRSDCWISAIEAKLPVTSKLFNKAQFSVKAWRAFLGKN